MNMFIHYLTLAFRNLHRHKFQTLFTVVGLGVAMFCFGICLYFVRGYMTIDHCFPGHDRIVYVAAGGDTSIQPDTLEQLKQRFPEIEAYSSINREDAEYRLCTDTTGQSPTYMMHNLVCDKGIRQVYGVRMLIGRWEEVETTPNTLLLCHTAACRMFGSDEAAIGQVLTAQKGDRSYKAEYTVRAVVEDLPYNNSLMNFVPLDAWVMNDEGLREGNYSLILYSKNRKNSLLLHQGTDLDDFIERLEKAEIVAIETHYFDNRTGEESHSELYFEAQRLSAQFEIEYYLVRFIVIGTPGLLILLSALSNFFHLLMSSIMMRRREYTLRRAHGAHTLDLWLMVGTQVLCILLLESLVTLVITEQCAPLVSINEQQLEPREMLEQMGWNLLGLLVIGMGVAWLAVARIRRDSMQESLKTSTGRRPGRNIVRNLLIGWQMTVGFLFLALLGGLIQQVRLNDSVMYPRLSEQEREEIVFPCMRSYDGGWFSIGINPESLDRAKTEPSIMRVIDNGWNLFGPSTRGFTTITLEKDTIVFGEINSYDSVLFRVQKCDLKAGRWPEKPDDILVDQSSEERYGIRVGQTIELGGYISLSNAETANIPRTRYVCGVIDNLSEEHIGNACFKTKPCVYMDYSMFQTAPKGYKASLAFQCYPGQKEQMIAFLKEIYSGWEDYHENKIVEYRTLSDYIREVNAYERGYLTIFWLFAVLSMIINMLGIFSAITMDTTTRRKEMAIRKINGAHSWHIALCFARLYAVLLAVSAAIAFPTSYLVFQKVAESGYRHMFASGFTFYASIFGIMTLFVAITIGVQIWQISRVNPAKTVKSE